MLLEQTFTLLLALCFGLSTALSSTMQTNAEEQAPLTTTNQVLTSTQPTKEEHFPVIAPVTAGLESESASLLPPLPASEESMRHRLVTYDQRQEGQYNIRADLENFMIVLIPPGPQEGLNLLDMLTKSSLRGVNAHSSKSKRKHYATRTGLKGAPISSLKSFYQRQQAEAARGYQTPQLAILREQNSHGGQAARIGLPEFIEGRTPYHVDISASDDEQARLHPERQQVDVLPPPYYPQLIKPFHLDAEPTLIQALPPAELNAATTDSSSNNGSGSGSSANLLEEYNRAGSNAHYYRNSRVLRGDTYLDSNRLNAPNLDGSSFRSIAAPIYRADLNPQADSMYPPIDVPAYLMGIGNAQARTWQLDDEPTPALQPKQLMETDVLTIDLLGDALDDSKTMLSELARCAPGQRRDSYGTCREIKGY